MKTIVVVAFLAMAGMVWAEEPVKQPFTDNQGVPFKLYGNITARERLLGIFPQAGFTPPETGSKIIKEDGGYLLMETNDKLLIE